MLPRSPPPASPSSALSPLPLSLSSPLSSSPVRSPLLLSSSAATSSPAPAASSALTAAVSAACSHALIEQSLLHHDVQTHCRQLTATLAAEQAEGLQPLRRALDSAVRDAEDAEATLQQLKSGLRDRLQRGTERLQQLLRDGQ